MIFRREATLRAFSFATLSQILKGKKLATLLVGVKKSYLCYLINLGRPHKTRKTDFSSDNYQYSNSILCSSNSYRYADELQSIVVCKITKSTNLFHKIWNILTNTWFLDFLPRVNLT